MIKIMPESEGNVLIIKASEKLTAEDYEETFIPTLDKLIEEHEKVRLIFYLDETFTGWELGAMWDDAKFGLKHGSDFEKCAVVGGPKWVEWATKITAHLMPGQVKTYHGEELKEAIEWIKE